MLEKLVQWLSFNHNRELSNSCCKQLLTRVQIRSGEMGCGLRKLKPSEESSPGKIYSTLKRPQVETKVGVAYSYQFLDFLVGKDDGSSTLCLLSVRELPGHLQALYQQGFSLAAVHPFIHPCGVDTVSLPHKLYRAVLIRLDDGLEKSQSSCAPYGLQLEQCLSADQVPSPELIQGYVKKQIQDAADQGVMFVGFIQEPFREPCTQTSIPETPSFSLHSSPSSVLGSLSSGCPTSPWIHGEPGAHAQVNDPGANKGQGSIGHVGEEEELTVTPGGECSHDGGSSLPMTPSSDSHSQDVIVEDPLTINNNKTNTLEQQEKRSRHTSSGVEILALFNQPTERQGPLKYYTVKVPLRVQLCDQGLKGVEANWLDHMTQHFNNGALLVDGYFHLGNDNDNDVLPKSVESIFVFQEGTEAGDQSVTGITMYDAIVVEQWTIIDGLQVKTDYVPLLQSLAMYGWRLTCVLPTPIIKNNSDGSMSTKQVIFLQRPVLPRKKRDSKKLIFKSKSSKANKTLVKGNPKNKKKNKPLAAETDLEDPKIIEEGEKNKDNSMEQEMEVETKVMEKQNEVEVETKDVAESGIESVEKNGVADTGDKEVKMGTVEEETEAAAETEKDIGGEKDINEERGCGGAEETEPTQSSEVQVETKSQAWENAKENGVETDEDTNEGQERGETENVAMQQDSPGPEEHAVQEAGLKAVKECGQVTLTNECLNKSQKLDV